MADYAPLLYSWVCNYPDEWPRLADRGTPSPAAFTELLWQSVLAQYVVTTDDGATPIGVATIHSANFFAGLAWVDLVAVDPRRDSEYATAAAVLVDFAFTTWRFRKLLSSATAPRPTVFSRLDVGDREASFPRDSLVGGEYRDRNVDALYLEDWESGSLRRPGKAPSQP